MDRKNRRWLQGHGSFHVTAVKGRSALVRQSGQRLDYKPDRLLWRLDLNSGALAKLPLEEELAANGRILSRVELADADFTLILITKKADAQEIWSRTADGALRRLAVTDHYYGTAEGQIWWYDVSEQAGARTDYLSGETVRERRANFRIQSEDSLIRCKASCDHRALISEQSCLNQKRVGPIFRPALTAGDRPACHTALGVTQW